MNPLEESMPGKTIVLLLIFFLSIGLLCCEKKPAEVAKPPAKATTQTALEFAWVSCTSLGNECVVIIWIRGTGNDTRLVFNGEPPDKDGLCHVEILNDTFHKHFKYCTLAGISAEANKPLVAQFGGGPAGEKPFYWFEWAKHVKPNFYCILR